MLQIFAVVPSYHFPPQQYLWKKLMQALAAPLVIDFVTLT
jgi:hypothetical protein